MDKAARLAARLMSTFDGRREDMGNPGDVMSALIDKIDAAEKERDAARAELERWRADAEKLMDEVVMPKAKAIEAERDAALKRVGVLESSIGKAKDMAVNPRSTELVLRMGIIGLPTKHAAQASGEFIRIKSKEVGA